MNAKDLRIGNWVKHNGKVVKVVGLSDRCVYILTPPLQKYFHTVPEQDIEPIEITDGVIQSLPYCDLWISDNNVDFCIHTSNNDYDFKFTEVPHLHQLQNLYHSLTGKELAYNE